MGDLISSAEQSALRPAGSKRYGKGSEQGYARKASRMFDMGKKIGERAVMGRYYVGLRNSGPQMGSHIMRGMVRASRVRLDPSRFADTFSIARILINTLTQTVGPHFSTALTCSTGATHSSGHAQFSNCGSPESVVADSSMGLQTDGRTVCTWRYLRPYGSPGFSYYARVQRFTKPNGYPSETVTVSGGVDERFVPASALLPRVSPVGAPMGWAPQFNEPVSLFNRNNEPAEQFYSGNAPWATADTGTGSAVVPLPGTQVITPTPNPPTTTTGNPPPSNKPGRGRREVKFAGKKIMLRLLRLTLAIGEGLDTVAAIADAIPKDKLKECRKAARQRYYRNKAENKHWGTVNWQMMPHEQTLCIYKNLEYMDLNHVFYNVVKNQIEDLWAGWQYGLVDGAVKSGRYHGGPVVTKNPFQHDPLKLPEWDDPFWDEVQDYMEKKGI